MAPQTVLVTGGTGFIALEIVHQLLSEGKFKVRATVRSLANEKRNKPLLEALPGAALGPPELVEADLLSEEGWAKAVSGVDFVLHTASPFFQSGDEDKLVKPAVNGTLNVLKACSQAGSKVKRVVITSSCAAVAYGRDDLPRSHVYTEADWSNPDNVDTYSKSKVLAERAAWDFVEKNTGHKFELNVVNPAGVFGHCRTTPGTSVDLIKQIMTREMPMIPAINSGLVDVEDVARAHIRAMTCAETSERFILSAEVVSFGYVADVLAAEFKPKGVDVPTTRMPYWLAWITSIFVPLLRFVVKEWDKEMHIDGSKAEKVLGFKYMDPADTIKNTGNSLIEAGIVVPKQ